MCRSQDALNAEDIQTCVNMDLPQYFWDYWVYISQERRKVYVEQDYLKNITIMVKYVTMATVKPLNCHEMSLKMRFCSTLNSFKILDYAYNMRTYL